MKLKALVAAFATAFVMVACDSSTSSDDDTVGICYGICHGRLRQFHFV